MASKRSAPAGTPLEELIGDPEVVSGELRSFADDAKVFSSARERLITTYAGRWVAVFAGRVQADAATLPTLLDALDERGIPRERAIVRFIDRNERTMIL